MSAGGACSGGGLGCGCTSQPLPAGGLPADQTVEGGAQVRITPAGMTKVNQLVQSAILGQLGSGTCVPSGSIGGWAAGADYCYENQGTCTPGCDVNVNVDTLTLTPTDN